MYECVNPASLHRLSTILVDAQLVKIKKHIKNTYALKGWKGMEFCSIKTLSEPHFLDYVTFAASWKHKMFTNGIYEVQTVSDSVISSSF